MPNPYRAQRRQRPAVSVPPVEVEATEEEAAAAEAVRVVEGTAAAVLEWVGGSRVRAAWAAAAEVRFGKSRKVLLRDLQRIAGGGS